MRTHEKTVKCSWNGKSQTLSEKKVIGEQSERETETREIEESEAFEDL